jgi:hypothetical protein
MFPTADMLSIDLVLPDFSSPELADDTRRSSSPTGMRTTWSLPTSCAVGIPPVIYSGC